MPEMPRCHDCRFWDPLTDPSEAPSVGACERLEAMPDSPLEDTAPTGVRIRALYDFDGAPVKSADDEPFGIAVATGRDFGCVLWEPQPAAEEGGD